MIRFCFVLALLFCSTQTWADNKIDSLLRPSIVKTGRVNIQEIGGNELRVVSPFGDFPVEPDGRFSAKVSKEGKQMVLVQDSADQVRGAVFSLPFAPLQIDAESTALMQTYMNGPLAHEDLKTSITTFDKLKNCPTFPQIVAFYRKNLKSASLADLGWRPEVKNPIYQCLVFVVNSAPPSAQKDMILEGLAAGNQYDNDPNAEKNHQEIQNRIQEITKKFKQEHPEIK